MDYTNVRRSETGTTPTEQHYRNTYRSSNPFPEQQVRFRWSIPVQEADAHERENVSQNFLFPPGYESYSPAFIHSEDSGTGNCTPYSPNFGSIVLYKTPAQHGDTESSKIMVDRGSISSTSELSCVKKMWR